MVLISQIATASVHCFICDAPVNAYIKQIETFTGYFACERFKKKIAANKMKVGLSAHLHQQFNM